jgi:RNA polymerase sigma-70 factor (ECF subfamily)
MGPSTRRQDSSTGACSFVAAPVAEAARLEALIRDFAPALRRFFIRRAPRTEDIEDLVQDVYVRLLRRGDLAHVDNLDGYIFQVAVNILRDRLRKRQASHAELHEALSENVSSKDAHPPETAMIERALLNYLVAEINELPDRTREIFILCRIEDVPYAEVCRRMGLSLSAVNKHVARAHRRLVKHSYAFFGLNIPEPASS